MAYNASFIKKIYLGLTTSCGLEKEKIIMIIKNKKITLILMISLREGSVWGTSSPSGVGGRVMEPLLIYIVKL